VSINFEVSANNRCEFPFMKKINPLSEILRELAESGSLGLDPAAARVLEAWPGIVPEALRPFVVLEGVRKGGILVVTVSDPVAGQQLQFFREDLRHRINQAVGEPLIRDLQVKMGPLPPAEPARKIPEEQPPRPSRSLTRRERSSIQRLTGEIKNAGVREGLQTLLEKSLRFGAPGSAAPPANKRRAARKPSKGAGPSVLPPRS
jgi:hypothetical protein